LVELDFLWYRNDMVKNAYVCKKHYELFGTMVTDFSLSLSVPGSADSLLRTFFPDGMSESLIAYLLHGVLKALQYLHLMGYVHR
jgi:serine/threonine protein kinase